MAPIGHSQLDEQSAPNSSPPSPPGSSSDKENPRRRTINKRSKAQMAPQSHDKRRRLTDRSTNIHSQIPSSQRVGKNKFYDPDQDVNERRKVRRDLRDLTREFNGMLSPSTPPHLRAFVATRPANHLTNPRLARRVPSVRQRWNRQDRQATKPPLHESQTNLRCHPRLATPGQRGRPLP